MKLNLSNIKGRWQQKIRLWVGTTLNKIDEQQRKIEHWARGVKFIVEIFLGAVALWGIWNILGLTTRYSTILSIALCIFLVVEAVPLYFDLMHISGEKRNKQHKTSNIPAIACKFRQDVGDGMGGK